MLVGDEHAHREEDRDAARAPEAREHADDQAEDAAREQEKDVVGLERGSESTRELAKDVHHQNGYAPFARCAGQLGELRLRDRRTIAVAPFPRRAKQPREVSLEGVRGIKMVRSLHHPQSRIA